MLVFKAGDWKVVVSNPWPQWVALEYHGKEIARMRDGEVEDLAYVLKRVMDAKRQP